MKLLIFKTDITSQSKVRALRPLFNALDTIQGWTIDTEDIDNVLRIEAVGHIDEHDVIHLMRAKGFRCEVLMD